MAYPTGVVLRTITVGDSLAVESGTDLTVRATLRSSRGLVWVASGERAVSAPEVRESAAAGEAVTFTPPVTDQSGWRDLATGALIDVSAPNAHTHTYTIELKTLSVGRPVDSRTIGPFALPTGDGSPVDADLLIEADTVPGLLVSVPDVWSAQVVQAVAAAGSADAAAGSADAAAGSAGAAAESADAAASSAGDAADSAIAARLARDGAVAARTGAETAQGLAEDAHGAAATSAGQASTSAGLAAGSASSAATSAGSASTAAGNASTAAGVASVAASEAAQSAITASQQAALAATARQGAEAAAETATTDAAAAVEVTFPPLITQYLADNPPSDGREVELQTTATHIQWRYVGSPTWTDLVSLASITGDDGLSVELRTTATHIQWRLVGGAWSNLVALSALVGPAGPPNVLSKGTVTTGAPGSAADFSITGTAPSQVLNMTIPRGDTGAVSAWEYYAAGRPDVVGTLDPAALAWRNAAPSGSTFYSTDGPQGAWVWRKRGTVWTCVEGDTGWRNYGLAEVRTIQPSVTSSALRRDGGTAWFRMGGVSSVSAMTTLPGWVPSGFRTSNSGWLGHGPNTSGQWVLGVRPSSAGDLAIGGFINGNTISVVLTWPTIEAWPTTLPGSPA